MGFELYLSQYTLLMHNIVNLINTNVLQLTYIYAG